MGDWDKVPAGNGRGPDRVKAPRLGRALPSLAWRWIVAVALTAGCAGSGGAQPSTTADPEPTVPTSAATAATGDMQVRVLGLWSGPEFDSFVAVKSVWEQDTGGTVDWQGARDLASELDAQIEAGAPPDVAILPNVGLLHTLAGAGQLVPLTEVMDPERIRQDYATPWIDLGSHEGTLYGIFYKVTDKATVWYSPTAFDAAGYRKPSTWDELLRLADTVVADGGTPFSVVAPTAPGGGGWALTDWVSQIVLAACGAERFDGWVAGTVPWNDECVKQSFERFMTIVHTPGYVLGGGQRIRSTGDAEGSYPLYSDPPDAYLYYLSSFAQAFIATEFPQLVPGSGYDFFPFPTIDPQAERSIIIGADIVVMLRDTPAARSFVTYLAGAPSQQTWIERGGFTSANRNVVAGSYPDPVARAVASDVATADVIRFSAGDSMPPTVQRAWWKAMLDLVDDPSKLDPILDELTRIAQQAR